MTNHLLVQIRRLVAQTWQARGASQLRPRSWKEPHLLHYSHENQHTGMIMHYDGGHLTWQLMLSEHGEDYEGEWSGGKREWIHSSSKSQLRLCSIAGGGTYLECLQKNILLRKGQILVHPGNLYHKGVDITSGSRTLMVCFMDGWDPQVEEDSLNDDDSYDDQMESNIVTFGDE